MANDPEYPESQQSPSDTEQQAGPSDGTASQRSGASSSSQDPFTDLDASATGSPLSDPTAAADDVQTAKEINRRTTPFGRIAAILIVGGAVLLAGLYFWREQKAEQQRERLEEIAQMDSVDRVVSALRDLYPNVSNSDIRRRVLKNLGHYRDEKSIPLLIKALDEGGKVRRAAAWALARIGPPEANKAKKKLLEVLPETDTRDRAQVVWTLAVLGEERASDAIVEQFRKGLLQDLDGFDPKIIAEVLGPKRLASDKLINHEAESVRRLTAHSLAASASPEAIDPLNKLLQAELSRPKDKRSREVIRAAAAGLGRTGDPRAAKPLFDVLQQAPAVKQPVLDALGKSTGAPGLASLVAEATDMSLKRSLVRLLADTHDPRTADALAGLLDSEDTDIRRTAAFALADIRDPRAGPTLIEIARGDDPTIVDRALGALIKVANPELSDDLVTMLDEMEARRATIVRILGETNDPEVGSEIRPVLETADSVVAAVAMGKLGYEKAYDKLLDTAKRPSDVDMGARGPGGRRLKNEELLRKRKGAIRAMGWYGRPEAVSALMGIVEEDKKEDYQLRRLAARAIGRCANKAQISTVIDRINDNELDKRSRRYYVQALWQKPHPELSDELLSLMSDEEAPVPVRRAAALAVGYANDPANDSRLAEMLESEDNRRYAAIALTLGANEKASKKLRETLGKHRQAREVLQRTLTNEQHDWFKMLTQRMFDNGQIYRRLQVADILREGEGDEGFRYAWSIALGVLRDGWNGPGGASVHHARMALYHRLVGDTDQYRKLAGKTLESMPENGLLLRARDQGGPGGKIARDLLREDEKRKSS